MCNNYFHLPDGLIKPIDPSTTWDWSPQPNFKPQCFFETARMQPTITPMKFETCTTAFKHNAVTGTWNLERLSNSGKLRVQELTRFFLPTLQEIVRDEDWQIRFVRITYQANGRQYRDISSGQDYLNRRYDKALRGITKLPGCTRRQLNDLVDWLLQTVPTVEIQSFSSPGWHTGHDGRQVYAAYDPSCDFPENYVPRSIKRRILRPLASSPQEVASRWKAIRAENPKLHFLLNLRLAGGLKQLLQRAGVLSSQFVNAIPSKGCDEQHLVALLVTGDIEHFPFCDLGGGDIVHELAESRCGTAVYVDHSFADDQNRVTQSLKSIIRAVHGDVDEELRQSSIFVISPNAWLTARQIDRDCVVILDTDGISLQHTAKDLHAAISEMDTLMIQSLYVLSQEEIVSVFQNIAAYYQTSLSDIPSHIRETFILFICVEIFLVKYFGCEKPLPGRHADILRLLLDERVDADCTIAGEFGNVLSQMFRDGTLHPVQKKRGHIYRITDHEVFVDGAWMWISGTVRSEALSRMTTIRKERTLNRVLQSRGAIKCTDGCVDPIEVNTLDGNRTLLRWYAHSVSLLDDDVVQRLANLGTEDFWLLPHEVPCEGFLPLLSDNAGRVAGVLIENRAHENHGVYFSGISGSGKSTGMAEVAAAFYDLGHRVIWLDSSNSAPPDALGEMLSPFFVENNIHFFNIDSEGVPVNLLCAEQDISHDQMRQRVFDVLSAACGDLSEVQADTLDSLVQQIADSHDMTALQISDILEALNNPGVSFASLRTRLKPILRGLSKCGMATASWTDFWAGQSRFSVIRVEEAFGESNSAFFDAMMISLFNWQRRHKDLPLHILIDEVHLQNLSKGGAIRKITSEGRKHMLSLCAASQDYPARGTDLGTAMGNVPIRVILKPSLSSDSAVAEYLGFTKGERSRLDDMQIGDAIVHAALFNKTEHRNIQATVTGKIHRKAVQDNGSNSKGGERDEK